MESSDFPLEFFNFLPNSVVWSESYQKPALVTKSFPWIFLKIDKFAKASEHNKWQKTLKKSGLRIQLQCNWNLVTTVTYRVCVCSVTCVQLFATLWTGARQTPLWGFSMQEYWSGLLWPPSVDLLDGTCVSYVSCIGRWVTV